MELQDMPNTQENKMIQKNTIKGNKGQISKLLAFLLIFSTLIICLSGGYYISEKYLWSNTDQNRLIEQLNYYKSQVDAEPNKAEHRVNLGYTYYLLDDNKDAIKQLQLGIDLDKNYFGAYFNLGLVYIDEERFNDALKQSLKTIELAPRNFRSHLLTGMVCRELEMFEEANEALKEGLNFASTNTDIINEIAKVAEDQGEFKEAEELFKEALTFDPLYKPATEGLERIAAKENK
jgi:tetratricopeptide (TPR) repeat protein